jgi:hypothetical protein
MAKKPQKKWIQKAELKEGSFTAQAKKAGMDVQAFANKVLANPENYSTTTVKRANLAKNFKKMAKSKK